MNTKRRIKGVINHEVVELGTAYVQHGPPHEMTFELEESCEFGDIMLTGLQYYDFSKFSFLIEILNDEQVYFFIIDNWNIKGSSYIAELVNESGESAYMTFNKRAYKHLTDGV